MVILRALFSLLMDIMRLRHSLNVLSFKFYANESVHAWDRIALTWKWAIFLTIHWNRCEIIRSRNVNKFCDNEIFEKKIRILPTFTPDTSFGNRPAPNKNIPNTRKTTPMCNIPMLVTTFVSSIPLPVGPLAWCRYLRLVDPWSEWCVSPLSELCVLNRRSRSRAATSRRWRWRLMAIAEWMPATACILKIYSTHITHIRLNMQVTQRVTTHSPDIILHHFHLIR